MWTRMDEEAEKAISVVSSGIAAAIAVLAVLAYVVRVWLL